MLFGRHPLDSRSGALHTVESMIQQNLHGVNNSANITSGGVASASGSGGVASETPIFDSLWSSYEEAIANSNVGWLRGYSLTPKMSAVIGGGETLANAMFGFDVPNNILHLGNATNQGAVLRIYESGGGGYFALQAAAASGNNVYTWPNGFPASTQFLQVSTGGIISYSTGSGGGATVFTGLADCPASYVGAGLDLVRVNAAETGLEFWTPTFMNSFILQGSSGTPQTIDDADTVSILPGDGIAGVVASATDTLTINSVWFRDAAGFIRPALSNDYLKIEQNLSTAFAAWFRSLHISGSTVTLKLDNASSANDSYGLEVDRIQLHTFIDMHHETAPASPPTSYNRLFMNATDGLLYYKNPAGTLFGPLIEQTNYWARTGTDLIPVTNDDDLLLHDGSTIGWGNGNPGTLDTWMKRGAAGRIDIGDSSTSFLFRVWGGASTSYTQMGERFSAVATASTDIVYRALISTDSVNRWQSDAAGLFSWGAGGAGAVDVTLSRIAANVLGLGSGDALRVGTYAELEGGLIPGAAPAANYGRHYYNSVDHHAYFVNEDNDSFDLCNPNFSSILQPATPKLNNTSTTLGSTDVGVVQYCAKAPKRVASGGTIKLTFIVTQQYVSAGTGAWAEVAILKGSVPNGPGNPSLTLLGSVAIPTSDGTGVKTYTITLSAEIEAGDDLWIGWGSKATTSRQVFRSVGSDEWAYGIIASATFGTNSGFSGQTYPKSFTATSAANTGAACIIHLG